MKKLLIISFVLALILPGISCRGQVKENSQPAASAGVSVYYFHFTRRCSTCLAVEQNAREAFKSLYPNEIKTGDYHFYVLNLDEKDGKEAAEKLGVGGQTLLIVKGEKKTDITGAAFLNAHDLEKLKNDIRTGVEKILY